MVQYITISHQIWQMLSVTRMAMTFIYLLMAIYCISFVQTWIPFTEVGLKLTKWFWRRLLKVLNVLKLLSPLKKGGPLSQ